MRKNRHGGPPLQTYVIVLLCLSGALAEDEQQPIAQPDFAIYHTKYVLLLCLLACPGVSPIRPPSPVYMHLETFVLLQGANPGRGGQHCKGQPSHHEGEIHSVLQVS